MYMLHVYTFSKALFSVITYGELPYGAQKSRERTAALQRLRELVNLLPALFLPDAAAEALRRDSCSLESQRGTIGNNRLWMATPALATGLMRSQTTKTTSRVRGLAAKLERVSKRCSKHASTPSIYLKGLIAFIANVHDTTRILGISTITSVDNRDHCCPVLLPFYSYRKATTGSTLRARCAGNQHANAATIAKTEGAARNVSGSSGETW